ncbi:unnamed protein product [Schistosoma curassoni]|uniref:Tetraspanin n=1 Tax=Schistosoma curassoni TaxID=6186 RepID=A0A183K0R1_9TREM|nr:unnamed protein product [Schistosoma curassoni]
MKLSLSEQGWNRLFLILNGVFLVYSIILFALGIKAQDDLGQFKTILQGINPPILPTIIFTGFIGIIGSITGYCKIMKPNQIVIILHITFMTIATITELCISLGTVMTPNEFITNANYTLKDSLNYYDIHPLYHEQFEQLQTNYKCCGSSMFTDYRRTNNTLPASCKNNETIYTVHIIGLIIATIIEISISISSSVSNNQVSYYANNDDDALDDDDDDDGDGDGDDDDDDDNALDDDGDVDALDDDDLHLTNSNQSLWNSLQYYQKHPVYENQFENLQKDFECCGVRSSKDYVKLVDYLPVSCEKGNAIHLKGCAEALYQYIEQSVIVIIYICIAFAIIKAIYLAISILVYPTNFNYQYRTKQQQQQQQNKDKKGGGIMILSIAEKYWKNIIILSNLIFIVYSIVLLSLGIDKLNFLNRFTIILHNAIPIIIPMIISSGLLCLITALIGLIGLIKQKQCIALIHIGGLLISTIIEFSTATMSAVSKDQFFMKVNSSLHESIIHYEMNYEIKNEFNNLQMTLGCCGASYFRDYLKIHSITPSSCKPTSYGFVSSYLLIIHCTSCHY